MDRAIITNECTKGLICDRIEEIDIAKDGTAETMGRVCSVWANPRLQSWHRLGGACPIKPSK